MTAAPGEAATSFDPSLWGKAVIGALAVGQVVGVILQPRPGGDYACFWAAGRLVLDGVSVFDEAALRAAEAPWLAGGWLPFAYPPATALVHASLAWLPYRLACAVHGGAMLTALVLIPRVLGPVLPVATRSPWLAAALLATWPAVRALLGGQATAVWMLLFAASARALHEDRRLLAGALAGGLWLKPTLGAPAVGLVVLAGGPWAALGAAGSAAAVWAASAAVEGPGWLAAWWTTAWRFQAGAQAVEGVGNVGVLGALEHALGFRSPVALAFGWAAVAALSIGLAVAWRRPGERRRLWLAGALLPLLPPHAVWYDAGFAGLAVLAVLDAGFGWRGMAVSHLALATPLLASGLGFQPLVPVLGLLGLAALRPRA